MLDVDDAGRVALRNERRREALTAVTGGVARIGVRASFAGMVGDPAWNASEVGLIAQVGAEPAFLAAYGAVLPGVDPYAVVAPGVSAVIAATIDVVSSAADVAVMVTPDLTVAGASTFASLLDTPAALTPGAYYRGDAPARALEARSAAQVAADVAPYFPSLQLAAVSPQRDGQWHTLRSINLPASAAVRLAFTIHVSILPQVNVRLRHAGAVVPGAAWGLGAGGTVRTRGFTDSRNLAAGLLEFQATVAHGQNNNNTAQVLGLMLAAAPA